MSLLLLSAAGKKVVACPQNSQALKRGAYGSLLTSPDCSHAEPGKDIAVESKYQAGGRQCRKVQGPRNLQEWHHRCLVAMLG